MPSHRARRVPSVALRTAVGTLLLTGVASAATVLVLSQAASTFTGTWSGRADGTIAAAELPPITVRIDPARPSLTASPTPPAQTPTVEPTQTPTATPPPTPPPPVDPRPSGHPTPTVTPTTPGTGNTGSGNPTTGPGRTPLVSVGEAGQGGGKTLEKASKTTGGTAVSFALGEVAHISLCTGKGVSKHCSMGYDGASPTSPSLAPVAPVAVPAPVPTPTPTPTPTHEPTKSPTPAPSPSSDRPCPTDSPD
ncbi:MAG: hypothetical protein QOG52_2906 [Frankiaceae bacterium]|nr:hypothetical protein [Frankiaceae bacterium]